MKNGLLVYTPLNGKFNIGDYIQSLAAKQFFSNSSTFLYIDRDHTNEYQGEPVKLIMNGWYSHEPQNWPPSVQINPLFVAININETIKDQFLTEESIAYFKRFEPIGCRDYNTQKMLLSKGIKAYFSGCLTLTLGLTYQHKKINCNKIYFVDPFFYFDTKISSLFGYIQMLFSNYKVIKNISKKIAKSIIVPQTGWKALLIAAALYKQFHSVIEDEVFMKAEFLCQEFKDKDYKNDNDKFKKADEILKKYENAQYVITSRIHCALPCLAMNTPVVFINKADDTIFSSCRFGGLLDLFNQITIKKGKVIHSFLEEKLKCNSDFKNKELHKPYQEELIKRCRSFTSDIL